MKGLDMSKPNRANDNLRSEKEKFIPISVDAMFSRVMKKLASKHWKQYLALRLKKLNI